MGLGQTGEALDKLQFVDRVGQDLGAIPAPESMLQLFWRRFRQHRLGLGSMFVLVVLVAICFIAPMFISEDEANLLNLEATLQPPSYKHPFGTDYLGRDMLLRAIFGGRISLRIGIVAALISVTVGASFGGIAGYNKGLIDNLLMRFTEALLSIPRLLLLILVSRIIGHSIMLITIVLGMLSWMEVSRIVRAEVLSLKEQDFVLAARAIGARPAEILVRHVMANAISPLLVAGTLGVGQAIIWEATLSFLGLGVQPPTATWGNMIFRAQGYVVTAPWIAIFPGLLIVVSVLCINFVGDGVRDAFNPYAPR